MTKSFRALQACRAPVIVLEGSSRSGKTHAILQYLLLRLMTEPIRVFAARHDGTTASTTIVEDFKRLAQGDMDCWRDLDWNATLRRAEFRHGGVLEFGGTSDPAKLHGREQDVVWLNEVMEITYDAYVQVTMRTRALRILDFNPSISSHWVFDRIMARPRSEWEYCHTTFRDNPFLPPSQVAEILRLEPTPANISAGTADQWKWAVYGLGKRCRREGVVYDQWELTDDWPAPHLCTRRGYGVDFGFSADPAAVVEACVWQDRLYVREVVYETGLVAAVSKDVPGLPSMQGRLDQARVDRRLKLVADSARPEMIRALQAGGYNVVAAHKSPDSILAGINLLRGFRLMVHRASQNLQRELEQYTWHRDRASGTWTDTPEDTNNHALDALRYWALADLRPAVARPLPGASQAVSSRRNW